MRFFAFLPPSSNSPTYQYTMMSSTPLITTLLTKERLSIYDQSQSPSSSIIPSIPSWTLLPSKVIFKLLNYPKQSTNHTVYLVHYLETLNPSSMQPPASQTVPYSEIELVLPIQLATKPPPAVTRKPHQSSLQSYKPSSSTSKKYLSSPLTSSILPQSFLI